MSDLATALIICVALILTYPIWMPILWLSVVAVGAAVIGIVFAIIAAFFFALAWICDLVTSAYDRWKKSRGAA